jgi:tetratricopeptide (TPR) repeat protein
MRLTGEKLPLKPMGRRSNPWRILIYLALIAGGVLLTRMVETGRVKRPLSPTPVPTRSSRSFSEEGKAFFSAGDMGSAIEAFEQAVNVDPDNGRLWAELARIQTYSSELETNYERRRIKLDAAITSIDLAAVLAPEDSFVHAVKAFVYDWSAIARETDVERNQLLNEAEIAAFQASEFDPEDPLSIAYRAEILTDQQEWAQALDLAEQAVGVIEGRVDQYGDLAMDIYRVYGTVLESLGLYRSAIEQYARAAAITPNLTFLYLRIGVNYRELFEFDKALENFNLAAQINAQLNAELQDQDPVPYIAIGKTYSQQGEFFAAAINMARALAINPTDPDLYGRLGIVYYKARNYESAIPVLHCAVEGCGQEESTAILCDLGYADCTTPGENGGSSVVGLLLAPSSVEYYYTYASALAYYSGTEIAPNGCSMAELIHEDLLSQFGVDAIVTAIVAENRTICRESAALPITGGSENPAMEETSTEEP